MKAEDKAEVKEDLRSVPEGWLLAMKNHYPLAETISDRAEAALKFLTDTVKSREIHYLHQLLISRFSVKSPQEGLVLS